MRPGFFTGATAFFRAVVALTAAFLFAVVFAGAFFFASLFLTGFFFGAAFFGFACFFLDFFRVAIGAVYHRRVIRGFSAGRELFDFGPGLRLVQGIFRDGLFVEFKAQAGGLRQQ